MGKRGGIVALATICALSTTACLAGGPNESAFDARMSALDGVESGSVRRLENLPFMYTYDASAWVSNDITADQMRALLDALADESGFATYAIHSGDTGVGPYLLSWEEDIVPTGADADALATAWALAADFPASTIVDIETRRGLSVDVRMESGADGLSLEEALSLAVALTSGVGAVDPAAEILVSDDAAHLLVTETASCPTGPAAAIAAVRKLDVRELDLDCRDGASSLTLSAIGADSPEAAAWLAGLETTGDITVTATAATDGVYVSGGDVGSAPDDVVALVTAAREIPGAPSATVYDTGVRFDVSDLDTVEAMNEAIKDLPAYQSYWVSFSLDDDEPVRIIKPEHTSGLVELQIKLMRLLGTHGVEFSIVGDDRRVSASITMTFPVDAREIAAVRTTELTDVRGLALYVRLEDSTGEYVDRLTLVPVGDGTFVLEPDDASPENKAFLDAWNAAG